MKKLDFPLSAVDLGGQVQTFPSTVHSLQHSLCSSPRGVTLCISQSMVTTSSRSLIRNENLKPMSFNNASVTAYISTKLCLENGSPELPALADARVDLAIDKKTIQSPVFSHTSLFRRVRKVER